jgi:RimJ/RimL family protein N-acetyltransferase
VPVALTGSLVELVPLDLTLDVDSLFSISNGRQAQVGDRSIGTYDPHELIWRYMYSGPFPDGEALRSYLCPLVESSNGLCLCVFDRPTGKQVGVTNFLNNTPEHLRIELGSMWYSPLVQGTVANTGATYLMLCHAFGLGYRRIEWKCNAWNTRSWRAAEKMGFRFEGVLEAYVIAKGCNHDSAWFRILDREWPDVKSTWRTSSVHVHASSNPRCTVWGRDENLLSSHPSRQLDAV